jgi:hypothetical protein
MRCERGEVERNSMVGSRVSYVVAVVRSSVDSAGQP